MRRRLVLLGTALALLVACGCAKPRVWQPARLDLHGYGTIGLVEFRSQEGHGAMATRRFLATLHAAQAGVPVLELGPLPTLLHDVDAQTLTPQAVRAIGERHGVDTLLLGDLQIDAPRPTFSVKSFTRANASAEMLGTLSARMLDASSGATIWSDEARGKRTVAHLDVNGVARPDFGAVDPEGEAPKLVDWLVTAVTDDFRGRWVRP